MGNKTKATMQASANKAERTAIAETLEARVASMGKMSTTQPKGKGKNKSKERTRKDTEGVGFHMKW